MFKATQQVPEGGDDAPADRGKSVAPDYGRQAQHSADQTSEPSATIPHRAAMSAESSRAEDSSGAPSILKQMQQRREWQEVIIKPKQPDSLEIGYYTEDDRERHLEDLFGFSPPVAPPDLNQQIAQLKCVQSENQTLVDHQLEIYQSLRQVLDKTLIAKGLDPSTYDLEILRTDSENAFIYHHPQLERPLICITSSLLLNMHRYLGELREGHLSMIFGHEIGHAIEGHYLQANPPEVTDYPDPIKVKMHFSLDTLLSVPATAIFSRTQEYKADEHGIDAVIASGHPAQEALAVLEYLVALRERNTSENERAKPKSFKQQTANITLLEQAATSHPPIVSRMAHGKGYVKVLQSYQIEKGATEPPPSAPLVSNPNAYEELNATQQQLLVKKIANFLSSNSRAAGLSTEDICELFDIKTDQHGYTGGPQSVDELRHLMLLIPALFRISHGHLPFIPFDSVSPEPINIKAPCSEYMLGAERKFIEPLLAYLRDSTAAAIRAEAVQNNWSEFATELLVLTDCAGIYHSPLYNRQLGTVMELAMEDPIAAAAEICRLGIRTFDLKLLPNSWIQGLQNSGSEETKLAFQQLQREESCDLRANLIKLLLSNGILDDADADTIVSFVSEVDRGLRDDPIYNSSRLDRDIGQAITLAVEEWDQEDQLALVRQLSSRLPPELSRADFVSVELLRNLREISLDDKSAFLKDTIPAGIQRDMMIAEILQTLVFDHISELDKDDQSPRDTVPADLLDQSSCDSLLLLLDTSWREQVTVYLPSWPETKRKAQSTFIKSELLYSFAISEPLKFNGQPSRESQIIDKLGELILLIPERGGRARWEVKSDYLELASKWHRIIYADHDFSSDKSYFEVGPSVMGDEPWYESVDSKGIEKLTLEHPDSTTLRSALMALRSFESSRPDQNKDLLGDASTALSYSYIPAGPIKDVAILRELSYQLLFQGSVPNKSRDISSDEMTIEPESVRPDSVRELITDIIPQALSQLSTTALQGNESGSFSNSLLSHAELNNKVGMLYDRYSNYLAEQFDYRLAADKIPESKYTPPTLSAVAQEIGTQALTYWREVLNPGVFEQLPARQMLELVRSYLVVPGYARDIELDRIMTVAQQEAGGIAALVADPICREIYDLLATSPYQTQWGKEIYQTELALHPEHYQTFESHLALLLSTHPPQSVARENELRRFFDGSANNQPKVTSWEQYDQVLEAIEARDINSSRHTAVYREAGLHFVKELLHELDIPPRDYAHTVLWFVGLKDESHLIRCYQAASKQNVSLLKDETEKLTTREREELIYDILAGQKGILRTLKEEVRQEFMDTIFYTIFSDQDLRETETIKSFKAIFDTMMFHAEPERAAQILGKFLTALHEGRGFDFQAKLFFESFGFVGIKTAQYLVSNTNLLPERLQNILMDLTSRVEGPDKRVIFEGLERQFGKERARELVQSIGERIGGGSLMSFYDVTLNGNPPRTGVIGMMRSDIVATLPEDIELVRRVIQTMNECPAIFGNYVVSEKLYDNLVWQSQLETDLNRTRNIHMLMRKEMEQFCAQNPGLSVEMPALWSEQQLSSGLCSLEQGPFIFMDKAKGCTLDRFIEQCKNEGEDGSRRLAEVHGRLAAVIGFQLSRGSVLHCDLHPGNILVDDSSGQIKLWVLDAGLSVELAPVLQENIRRIITASLTQEQSEGIFDQIKARLSGVGRISDDTGIQWTTDLLHILEVINGQPWDREARAKTAKQLWDVLSNTENPFRERLHSSIDIIEDELGLKLPRDMYGVLRALGVSQHIFEGIDKQTAASVLRPMVKDAYARSSGTSVKWAEFESRLVSVLETLGIDIPDRTLQQHKKTFLAIQNPIERLDYISSFARELSQERYAEIKESILKDQEIQEALGISGLTRYFDQVKSQRRDEAESLSRSFVASSKLPTGQAGELALDNRFGAVSNPWRKTVLPGSLMRTEKGGSNMLYRVCYYDANHEAPERALVKPIHEKSALDFTPILIEGHEAKQLFRVTRNSLNQPAAPRELPEEREDFYRKFAYTELVATRAQDVQPMQDILNETDSRISIMEHGEWIPLENYRWNFKHDQMN